MATPTLATREMLEQRQTVLGHRVRVLTWPGRGSGGRPPLLLLNGLGGRAELLAPLADALADREVVTFDVPGAGESATPKVPYTLPLLAWFTARLLDRLGHRRVDVLGYSWGGMLAQQFAFQHPRRCRRLVLAATVPGTPMVPGRPSTLLKVATPRRFNDPEYARRIAGDLYGGAARTAVAAQHPPGRTSRVGYLLQQLAVAGWCGHLVLPLLRQPTLVLAGDDDPLVPLANARWIAALVPGAQLRVLPDGHHFPRSSAGATARHVDEFLG